jgi:acyl-CoA synthetase (AMP-forming)/AMP-acid ligase II
MIAALATSDRTADKAAVLGNDPVTFAELYGRACERVDELASAGVGHGSIVAVLCYNETFVYEYLVAAGHLGAALMPLSPALTDHELRALLEKAEAAVLLISPNVAADRLERLRQATGRACYVVSPTSATGATGALTMPRADSTCWVSPTGGSTGTPRLFAISHERLLTNSILNAYEWQWSRYTTHLALSPIAHGIGFSHSVGQLATGGTVMLVERYSAEVATRYLSAGSAWTAVVPTMIHDLLEYADRTGVALDGLSMVVSAGAPLSVRLRDQLLTQLPTSRLIEYYGSTELGWIAWLEHRLGEPRNGLVGMPVVGSSVRIVDENGNPRPHGQVGRIEKSGRPYAIPLAGGPSAYEANASAWELSGDVGYIDSDGALIIAGRADDMVVVGGQNVYPVEVENVIREHLLVREVVVRGVEDARLGQQTVAFVELSSATDSGFVDELMKFCSERLAKYKRPSRIVIVDALPRNSAGKPSRSFDVTVVSKTTK